jgi:hypothetical protein
MARALFAEVNFVARESAGGVDDVTCAEVVERLTDYLEDVLSPDEVATLRSHLSGCDGCTAYLDELRATMSVVGHPPPDDLLEEQTEAGLLDMFRKWVDPDDAGGAR